jgi:hypothetical protein
MSFPISAASVLPPQSVSTRKTGPTCAPTSSTAGTPWTSPETSTGFPIRRKREEEEEEEREQKEEEEDLWRDTCTVLVNILATRRVREMKKKARKNCWEEGRNRFDVSKTVLASQLLSWFANRNKSMTRLYKHANSEPVQFSTWNLLLQNKINFTVK